MKISKTNAMRYLDTHKVKYEVHSYDTSDGQIDGISVATKCNQPVEQVFKTLVTRSNSKKIYVFVVPVSFELDLKACAKAVSEKSIEMIHVNEINALTGYIRGGCSPLGMKKNYPICVSDEVNQVEKMIFSGGKIGLQIECKVEDFLKVTQAQVAKITG